MCGHRDDHTCLEDVPHANPGNFITLFNFRIKSGDPVLPDHLKSCGRNASFTSKTIQNEVIAICGKIIVVNATRSSCFQSVQIKQQMHPPKSNLLSASVM